MSFLGTSHRADISKRRSNLKVKLKLRKGNRVWWAEEWTFISGTVVEYNDFEVTVLTDCGKVTMKLSWDEIHKGKCPHLRY